MFVDLLIGFLTGHAIVWGGTSVENVWYKSKRNENQLESFESNKTDIDPVTGDYTSKYDGLRHDKFGIVKWREYARK